MKLLSKKFYLQDTAKVAKGLLGKIIVRRFGNELLMGRIVETEAYYGLKDPASRAFTTPRMAEAMWNEGGSTFVYMVHNNYLLNIVTGKLGNPQAVLIRAAEPLKGIEMMKKYRNSEGFDLTNGPGKLTQALKLSKEHHNICVFDEKSDVIIMDFGIDEKMKIASSNRIGVKKDLKRKLRFYLKDSKWVSKGKIIGQF